MLNLTEYSKSLKVYKEMPASMRNDMCTTYLKHGGDAMSDYMLENTDVGSVYTKRELTDGYNVVASTYQYAALIGVAFVMWKIGKNTFKLMRGGYRLAKKHRR